MQYRSYLAVVAATALSACGGSGANSLGGENLPGPPEFNALLLEADELASKLDGLGPSAELPTENDVAFEGVMVAADGFEDATEGYIGEFSAEVDFVDGEMTGVGSNFFFSELDSEGNASSVGEEVAGSITASSTNVATGLVDFTFEGTLFVDGLERTITSGVGEGGFFGTDGDMMAVEGDLEFAGTVTSLDVAIVAD